ncbi:hypothetical protein CPC08DRAFT_768636 [Agrocybe pediades]|nr:hypothetical protein CPC08DRAFT_768636 [Agrocybe pediades]
MSTLLPPSYIPTINEQKTFIGTGLHSALLFQFLMGIYVGVFVVTLNIYGHRDKEQQHRSYHKLIIASIVLIFLTTLISFVLCWWLANTVYCNDADTRFSIVLANATARLPLPLQTLLEISGYAGFVLADGVLQKVWRCFHACGGRLTASFLLPMGMFIAEIALGFAALAFNLLTARPAPAATLTTYYKAYNHITGAVFAAIAATSIMATFLICKTIHTHTTHTAAYAILMHEFSSN